MVGHGSVPAVYNNSSQTRTIEWATAVVEFKVTTEGLDGWRRRVNTYAR
jgi:hypothetical protein